jgi:hypothetical protein
MSEQYGWKPGSRLKISPQIVGEELISIQQRQGALTPAIVVEESRPENAPLHSEFEWRDDIAAEEFRKEQARHMIRHVVVRKETTSGEPIVVRAFVSVTDDQAKQAFFRIEDAMSDPDKRNQVLQQALRDLNAWRRKYDDLTELSAIFAAIDEVAA